VTCVDQQTKKIVHDARDNGTLFLSKIAAEARLCGQKEQTLKAVQLHTQSVPRSKHSVSGTKTSRLMLYRAIIAVCSEIHTEHANGLWVE